MTLKQGLSVRSLVNLMNRNITRLNIFIQSQDSTVSIVTRLKAWKSGVQMLAGTKIFALSQYVQTSSRAHKAFLLNGYHGLFPRG
jgi:hypothetical protein